MSLIVFHTVIFHLPVKRNRNLCSAVWSMHPVSAFHLFLLIFSLWLSAAGSNDPQETLCGVISVCLILSIASLPVPPIQQSGLKKTAPHLFLLCDLLFSLRWRLTAPAKSTLGSCLMAS